MCLTFLTADLDRVIKWCSVAVRFMSAYGCPFLYADCRGHYGSILLVTGHWEDADRELHPEVAAYAKRLSSPQRIVVDVVAGHPVEPTE